MIIAFLVFIGVSLLWLFTLASGQEEEPEGLYVADRSLSPVFNGFAIAGEQITVVTLLVTSGFVALYGYDGFSIAVDLMLGLCVLLLLAQKIRDSRFYTLSDLFSLRASGRNSRIAAALVTLAIAIPILMVQLRATGISVALLIGRSTHGTQVVCTLLMGILIGFFAVVVDLRGTSFIQVVKVVVTLATLSVMTLLALSKFEWSPGDLLSAAAEKSMSPNGYLSPGLWPRTANLGPLNVLGEHIVLILGTAVLPNLILRVSASPNGRSARRSTSIAAGLVTAFLVLLSAAGFAAAAVVGGDAIWAVDEVGQGSSILLASEVLPDGSVARVALITAMASVAFLAALTTVSSVAFAAAVAFARDVTAHSKVSRTGTGEVRVLRVGLVVLFAVSLSLAAVGNKYPAESLVIFALCVAASCIFPALIYTFFWPRFNRRGLLWSVYGGLLLCLVLTISSPVVTGTKNSIWPGLGFNWYPYYNAGLVSVPAALFLGWVGSITSPKDPKPIPGTVNTGRPTPV
ncbi:transporter [Streptomyces sp. NPDC057651]|uniref:sodium:solute symporter family transporter n=1 Tax=Streptomyces sp. NPDC057651 TaxID=3346194 RepID=UPI0036CE7B49